MKQILNIFPYCKGKVNYLNYKHHLYLYCKKQIIMETQEQCRMTKDVVKTTYIPHTHDKLGINIHIPENATVEINNAGAKKEYLIDSVEIVFP